MSTWYGRRLADDILASVLAFAACTHLKPLNESRDLQLKHGTLQLKQATLFPRRSEASSAYLGLLLGFQGDCKDPLMTYRKFGFDGVIIVA